MVSADAAAPGTANVNRGLADFLPWLANMSAHASNSLTSTLSHTVMRHAQRWTNAALMQQAMCMHGGERAHRHRDLWPTAAL
jgi:hypothetical protein